MEEEYINQIIELLQNCDNIQILDIILQLLEKGGQHALNT